MNVQVIGLDQRVTFGTQGQVQNFLVIRLPNGKEARAAIDLDTTKELLALDANGSNGAQSSRGLKRNESDEVLTWEAPAVPEPLDTTGLMPAEEPVVGASDAETVEWNKLPDNVLNPAMKAAFHHLGVSSRLTPVQVRSIESEVNEKFGPEEWREVLGPMAEQLTPMVQSRQKPVPKPPIAQVQWADGSPMMSGSRPARTLQKTAMGYPITDDGTIDAGEVVGGSDSDEDGVGQL